MSDDAPDFSSIPPAAGYDGLGDWAAEIVRLAALPQFEYDRARKAEAKRLGVLVRTLDKHVQVARPHDGEASAGQGRPIELPEIELHPDPVDGAELIGDLIAQIRRFIVLGDHDAVAVALWIIFAHAHDAAFHSPRLAVLSPLHRCGKSTLLRVVGMLVVRKIATSSVTASATFRLIESACGHVVLLIDELDNVDAEKSSELTAIINAGHCQLDAHVMRTVPVAGDLVVRQFSCWAPTVLAAIKTLPVTWVDRSVTIRMARKGRGERVERLREDKDLGFDALASRAARWAADHLDQLRGADPHLPATLDDRAADNWRMLVAIADLAGADWGRRARDAAIGAATADVDAAQARGELLLADIRDYFDQIEKDRTPSLHLVVHLNALEGRPWHEYSRGSPMSQNQLANLLRPFKIKSGTIRFDDAVQGSMTAKGYMRDDFAEAWNRYLPQTDPSQSVTSSQATAAAGFSDSQSVTSDSAVTDRNRPKAMTTATCDDVTDRSAPNARKQKKGAVSDNGAAAFEPTDAWQDFPDGAVCPPGLHYQIDPNTGLRRARKPQVPDDLICAAPDCAAAFQRPPGRGRPPKFCPAHRRARA